MNIASEFERIFAGKADIVYAIEEKGVEVPQGTRINEMAPYVRSIQTGGGGAPAIHADQHRYNNTLTWDGDTTGKVTVDPWGDGSEMWYRVSDVVPTMDDLANGYVVKYFIEDNGETVANYTSLEDAVDSGFTDHDGGLYDFSIAIIPTDNYTFQEITLPTIPKKGIYLIKWPSDGYYVSSLTIPGYAFDEGTDPITPEMISAAPACHASADQDYGKADNKVFGHVKLASSIFEHDGDYAIDPDGAQLWEANLGGWAASAYSVAVMYRILNARIVRLEQEIAALKG